MKLTSKGKTEVDQVAWGIYLWQMPNGSFISDDEGHFLMIQAMKGHPSHDDRVKALKDMVKSDFGITEGRPVFFSGHRPVTDEEYEEQRQRLLFGLDPDPLSATSFREDAIHHANQR